MTDIIVHGPPKIHAAMIAVMADVDPIKKDRSNTQQHYKFRGIDDVYLALQAILAAHGVYTTSEIVSHNSEERQTKSGTNLIYRVLHIRYTFHAFDGSSVCSEVIGEGMDSGDKAANKAMSVAHKYALLQAFCIPTDDPKDPETEHHEIEPKSKKEPSPPPPRAEKKVEPMVYPKFDANNPAHIRRLTQFATARNLSDQAAKWLVIAMNGQAIEPGAFEKVLRQFNDALS